MWEATGLTHTDLQFRTGWPPLRLPIARPALIPFPSRATPPAHTGACFVLGPSMVPHGLTPSPHFRISHPLDSFTFIGPSLASAILDGAWVPGSVLMWAFHLPPLLLLHAPVPRPHSFHCHLPHSAFLCPWTAGPFPTAPTPPHHLFTACLLWTRTTFDTHVYTSAIQLDSTCHAYHLPVVPYPTVICLRRLRYVYLPWLFTRHCDGT